MFAFLQGQVRRKAPPTVVLEVAGVGYEVDVPLNSFHELPALGEVLLIHVHLVVREDGHYLFGFLREDEKNLFRQLIKVSGIGARTALGILSGLTLNELVQAIEQNNVSRLTRVPGIGKKTAERMVLELRDRLKLAPTSATDLFGAARVQSAQEDIAVALLGT